MPVLIPELLWRDGRFRAGLALEHDPATGRIVRVSPAAEFLGDGDLDESGAESTGRSSSRASSTGSPAGSSGQRRGGPASGPIDRMFGRAVIPGFVNAHSHAFQRLIRGRTQWRQVAATASDFWSWREAMYAAALALSPDDVFHVSRFCFLEMLRAGITAVGEFHYLHRDPEGRAYTDPNELAHRVIAAAEDVGIRIALLKVCYAAGGIGRPLLPEQRRFATPELGAYLDETAALRAAYRDVPRVSVGIAPHSIRAVPRPWLRPLHAWAVEHDVAFHMHVSEQTREVEACLDAYGARPVELLAESGLVDERLTAIHATHLTDEEIAHLGDAGATVCACPTTERDLGDGFLPGAALIAAGARIALGSDSQTVIDPFEEMRLIEYHERLRQQRRVVLTSQVGGDRLEVAPGLLEMATEAGAGALRLDAGRLEAGSLADFMAVDLHHPALAGWTPDTLPAMLTLSAPADVVTDVWVGGVRRLEGRRHALDEEAGQAIAEAAARVFD